MQSNLCFEYLFLTILASCDENEIVASINFLCGFDAFVNSVQQSTLMPFVKKMLKRSIQMLYNNIGIDRNIAMSGGQFVKYCVKVFIRCIDEIETQYAVLANLIARHGS